MAYWQPHMRSRGGLSLRSDRGALRSFERFRRSTVRLRVLIGVIHAVLSVVLARGFPASAAAHHVHQEVRYRIGEAALRIRDHLHAVLQKLFLRGVSVRQSFVGHTPVS